MTKITANVILLIMAGTWAYLSVEAGELLQVGDRFVWLALALASGEGVNVLTKQLGGRG